MPRRGPKPALPRTRKPRVRAPDTAVNVTRVITFIETLTITSGQHAGQPFRLRPWQKAILKRIYTPGVRDVVITMGRKNGKTSMVSGLALAHLVGPAAVPRGQIVSAASDREQASLIFNEAKAMVDASPKLKAMVQVYETARRLTATNGSTYTALPAEAFRVHGLSPTLTLYDELAQAQSDKLYHALTTAAGAHVHPLRIVISTVSDDPHHIMSELCSYGEDLAAGILEDPGFVYINYRAPDDCDPFDETVWPLANPALGDFRSLDDMRTLARKAQRIPSLKAAFMRYFLNMPVSTEQRSFATAEDWDACGAEAPCEGPCYGGLDLSSSKDMTSLVLLWPETGAVRCWFWLPREDLTTRAEQDRAPYPLWVEQGYLQVTNGRTIDKRAVVATLAEVLQRYEVVTIGYDRWRIDELKALLGDEGVDIPLEPVGQGYRDMSPALDALERRILNRELAHGKHPILRWNVASAVVSTDPAGNRKLDKRRSLSRIDGAVSLAMAALMSERHRPEPALMPSVMWL